jgi:DNA-binding NarL/FixJ family response regulator
MNSPPYVLLVDDDHQIVRMMKKALETDGFEVLTVTSGKAALDAVRRRRPDLLVLDFEHAGARRLGRAKDRTQPVSLFANPRHFRLSERRASGGGETRWSDRHYPEAVRARNAGDESAGVAGELIRALIRCVLRKTSFDSLTKAFSGRCAAKRRHRDQSFLDHVRFSDGRFRTAFPRSRRRPSSARHRLLLGSLDLQALPTIVVRKSRSGKLRSYHAPLGERAEPGQGPIRGDNSPSHQQAGHTAPKRPSGTPGRECGALRFSELRPTPELNA